MTLRALTMAALLVMGFTPACFAVVPQPLVTDSRIKTFVYNENDVYSLLTHYGYQCNIEFGAEEEIEAISVGDRVGWQIVPAGRRLFIRAMEEGAHTNMTVVTSKRSYQFDLRSSLDEPLTPTEELVYVVRFFYPDKNAKGGPAGATGPAQPVQTQDLLAATQQVQYNFQYTFTGPMEFAPVKIFDDGQYTYFKLQPQQPPPAFFVLNFDGSQIPVQYSTNAQGYAVVRGVAPRFTLRQGDQMVVVYNEQMAM